MVASEGDSVARTTLERYLVVPVREGEVALSWTDGMMADWGAGEGDRLTLSVCVDRAGRHRKIGGCGDQKRCSKRCGGRMRDGGRIECKNGGNREWKKRRKGK
jgi:hypothetical protein